MRDLILQVHCTDCNGRNDILVDDRDYQAWQNGELIQKVMPYLNPSQRELLISGICAPCFTKLFGEEEECD